MTGRGVVPIGIMARRAPEAGRIRIGVKTAKAMKSIDTFRFTSADEAAIRKLAELYGGKVEVWKEPRARVDGWQVVTTSNKIDCYLIADGLSQHYEMWSGGGCLRRCDGVTVEQPEMHGEEAVIETSPCICAAKNKMECRVYTRLTIVLPQLPFAGTWRLESKGWNAAAELPGMFDMVRTLNDRGVMVQAVLGVERRQDVVGGKKRNFVVPTLAIKESPLEIQAGAANVGALGAGDPKAIETSVRSIGSGSYSGDGPGHPDDDEYDAEDIVDGEVVDPEEMRLRELLADDAAEHGVDPDEFVHALASIDGGIAAHGARVHADIQSGKAIPISIEDGHIKWKRET